MPGIAGGKFVVVGGASQVGAQIAEQLLAADAREVVLLDNLLLGSTENMESMLRDTRCKFVRADVLRLQDLVDPLAEADGAFMVAAFMATSLVNDPWTGLDVNIRGLQNTLEACRLRGVNKIVLSSSAGLYGTLVDEPTEEDAPLRWDNLPTGAVLYGASKVVGEALARLYLERYALGYIGLRYTAVYGERQHRRALVGGHIAEVCDRIRRGIPPIIDGDGLQEQDYINVADVGRANLLAMESNVIGESMNICSGVVTSQKRIVQIALEASGSDPMPELRSPLLATKRPAAARPSISREKAKRLLNWEPRVSIDEGVRTMLRSRDRS